LTEHPTHREHGGDAAGEELIRATRRAVTVTVVGASVVGALVVFVFLVVLPDPENVADSTVIPVNAVAFVVYLVAAIWLGLWWGPTSGERRLTWLRDGRPPTPREQRLSLRLPLLQTVIPGVFWGGAALLFGLLNARYSAELGERVATTVAMGGVTTCALSYLLCERMMRPVAARALRSARPSSR
jgi:adenylate cyclase